MQPIKQATPFARQSLLSITLTVILATGTHAYEFGYRAFIAGLIIICVFCILNIRFRRTKNKTLLLIYELLNAWIIIGFGVVNGLWNHAFKVFLKYLHGGSLPPLLARLFANPQTGSFFYESAAILTFAAGMFAAYYGFKLIEKRSNDNAEIH